MSDLDDKLIVVINSWDLGPEPTSIDEMIAEIKQAFDDEGYEVVVARTADGKGYGYGGASQAISVSYLSGKQWYEKFVEELPIAGKLRAVEVISKESVLKAAKKASGIK